MSDCLQAHRLQHARLPCPSPSPVVCPNSCPLSQWCHPIISSSVFPFSFCLQSFPASGSFPVCRLLASGDQSIGASASASILPMNIQSWFPLELTGLIALLSRGLSRGFFKHHNSKASILWCSAFIMVHLSHPSMTIVWTRGLYGQGCGLSSSHVFFWIIHALIGEPVTLKLCCRRWFRVVRGGERRNKGERRGDSIWMVTNPLIAGRRV